MFRVSSNFEIYCRNEVLKLTAKNEAFLVKLQENFLEALSRNWDDRFNYERISLEDYISNVELIRDEFTHGKQKWDFVQSNLELVKCIADNERIMTNQRRLLTRASKLLDDTSILLSSASHLLNDSESTYESSSFKFGLHLGMLLGMLFVVLMLALNDIITNKNNDQILMVE